MRACLVGLFVAIGACVNTTSAPHPSGRPQWLAPCELNRVAGGALCGGFEVFEDRDRRQGRRIRLRVAVLPATGPTEPDPLVFFAGGPGDSAVGAASYVSGTFAALRRSRDIVLIDQRGTGGSHPLTCNLYPGSGAARLTGAFLPLEVVEACRARLSGEANLGLYTTTIAVDDAAELLSALGYDRVNLVGGSYGTRMAQVFLRRHPRRVRTVILNGVSPLADRIPLTFPRDAQTALDGLLAECEHTPECRSAFPNARAEAAAVFERTRRGPIDAAVQDRESGATVNVSLPGEMVGEVVRWLLYSPVAARRIPDLFHRAASGDWAPLAEAAIERRRQTMTPGSIGLYLSVTCAEDLPGIDPEEASRGAHGTFLGDYRYREQRAACGRWVAGAVPDGFHEPVASDAPVLLLSGALDPVTPPDAGAQVAARLKNSLHVVVPAGAHGFGGLRGEDCLRRLQADFIERGAVAGLDTSCVADVRPPTFVH
jgi:pimeloyl-ACP methyl ester carboxylesterase